MKIYAKSIEIKSIGKDTNIKIDDSVKFSDKEKYPNSLKMTEVSYDTKSDTNK